MFKYRKTGKGRILHCWNDRIIKDYSIRDGNEVRCSCGSLIGIDMDGGITMKQGAFIRSGSVSRK
ncbi:hypothetical protein ACFL4P_02745 [Gemmatimonadota bacterium]